MNSHPGLQARIADYEEQLSKSDLKPADPNEENGGLAAAEASAEAEVELANEDTEGEVVSTKKVRNGYSNETLVKNGYVQSDATHNSLETDVRRKPSTALENQRLWGMQMKQQLRSICTMRSFRED